MRKMHLVFCLLPFGALPAFSAQFVCRSDFDEGSHYELTARVEKNALRGPALFRFKADDGLDLEAELSITEQSFESQKSAVIKAKNDSMGVELETLFKQYHYSGVLRVSFDLDSVESLELDVSCTLEN